jgi:membrane-bound metal-dependent hydrolase YbcI (DUF457 family)
MQRGTHIAFGIFLFAIFFAAFRLDLWLAAFVAIGAVFPDLDFQKPVRHLHRKLLHNIWVMAGMFYVVLHFLVSMWVALAFALGFASHLIADSLTPTGIRPFWPHPKKYCWHKYSGITTGKYTEHAFQAVIVVLSFLIFVWAGVP